MIEKDKEVQVIIKDISENIVSQIAPEEIDVFDEIADTYFNNPHLLDPNYQKAKDDPIGFGLTGMVEMTSPAALSVVTSIIVYIITQIWGATTSALLDEYKSRIKKLFNKNSNKKDVPAFTKEQLKRINDEIIKQALSSRLSEDQAKNIANALISSMVLNQ